VIKSLVQVGLPKGLDQNGIIHWVLFKCGQITCTSMYAL